MFVELVPLLAGRTVFITVAKADDKTFRVNVIPHGKAEDNPALSTACRHGAVFLDRIAAP